MLPFPVQTAWSTTPHYTSAPMPPFQQSEATGLTPTVTPIRTSPTEMQGLNMMKALNSSQINAQMSDFGLRQLQDGLMEQAGTMKLFVSDPVTQVVNQGSASLKISPSLGVSAQENPEAVLPGIETLLNAIQVVEGEAPAGNNQAAMFTKFTALNSADSADARLDLLFYVDNLLACHAIWGKSSGGNIALRAISPLVDRLCDKQSSRCLVAYRALFLLA